MNILALPLEILEKIIALVPDQLTLGQTCKTFYEISCRLKCFKITIYSFSGRTKGTDVKKLEENEELFQSIASSKRKITAMSLHFYEDPDFQCHRSLKMLFENFGRNLSELEIVKCNLSMEHIVKIENPGSFQLDLPNLRKLAITRCQPNVLEIFNFLPDNVLTKVVVYHCEGISDNVFKNQRNIKELFWKSKHLAIDTTNLKLESLGLSEDSYSRNLFVGQGSLTYLSLPIKLKQEDIDAISTLENIKDLKIETRRFLNLAPLRKLTKLVKLDVMSKRKNDRRLETLQSLSINDLTFYKRDVDHDFAVTLSLNCPKVRKLQMPYYMDGDRELRTPGWIGLKALMEQYPELEYLSTTTPFLDFPREFVHRNLKRLRLVEEWDLSQLKFFLEGFVSLETVEIEYINAEILEAILTARPNLKTICVEDKYVEIDEEFLKAFWMHGRHLESFHFTDASVKQTEDFMERVTQGINGGLRLAACLKAVRKNNCCKH